jgi:hypothetical protein
MRTRNADKSNVTDHVIPKSSPLLNVSLSQGAIFVPNKIIHARGMVTARVNGEVAKVHCVVFARHCILSIPLHETITILVCFMPQEWTSFDPEIMLRRAEL